MEQFAQQLLNGLFLGSIYALIALGYTMVYGVLRFINFAHSDVLMLGAFAAFFLALGVGLWRRTPWARYLVLIPCVVWLFSFPIGSAVGVFGIYAFAFDKDVRAQFGVMTPAATVTRVSAKKKR